MIAKDAEGARIPAGARTLGRIEPVLHGPLVVVCIGISFSELLERAPMSRIMVQPSRSG